MNTVVIISFSEDGDPPSVEEMSKDAFLKRLENEYYGSNPVFAEPGKEIDSERFSGIVVIEGKVVRPKVMQYAIKFDL